MSFRLSLETNKKKSCIVINNSVLETSTVRWPPSLLGLPDRLRSLGLIEGPQLCLAHSLNSLLLPLRVGHHRHAPHLGFLRSVHLAVLSLKGDVVVVDLHPVMGLLLTRHGAQHLPVLAPDPALSA